MCDARGEDSVGAAKLLNNIANMHRARHEFDRALELYRRALATADRALGSRRRGADSSLDDRYGAQALHATALNNIGTVYLFQGRTQDALDPLERALREREALLGADHPHVASSQEKVGMALIYLLRDLPRALSLLEQARATKAAKLGNDHRDTVDLTRRVQAVRGMLGQM